MQDPSRKSDVEPRSEPDKLLCDNCARDGAAWYTWTRPSSLHEWVIKWEMIQHYTWSKIYKCFPKYTFCPDDILFLDHIINIQRKLCRPIKTSPVQFPPYALCISVSLYTVAQISRGERKVDVSPRPFKWNRLGDVIITVMGDSCLTRWCQGWTWFFNFLQQVLNLNFVPRPICFRQSWLWLQLARLWSLISIR